MKYKRKMGNGLAFTPEKDMELFRKMAKEGYHLCGVDAFWYRFEKGEPKDYIFSHTAVKSPDEDYIAYFTEAGWEPVILLPYLQIFKALPSTEPIFTDNETVANFYKTQMYQFLKYTIFTTILFALCLYFATKLSSILSFILYTIGLIPFVFTVMPFFGFLYHYKKHKKELI